MRLVLSRFVLAMPFEVSWMATGVSGPRAVPQTEMMDPGASPRPNIEKGKSLAASVMPAIVGTGAVTVKLTGIVNVPFEISLGVSVRKAL